MLVQARDRPHAVGRYGQARSGLGIRFLPALQRQQGDDHLQVVQQPVMALLGQHLLLADRVVLLAKQRLVAGESLSQLAFRGFVLRQLAFVARDRAPLRAFEAEQRGDARAERDVSEGHGALTFPAFGLDLCRLRAVADIRQAASIQV